MDELFPIAVGLVLGVLVSSLIRIARLRVALLLAVSVIGGLLASYVSGELLISWSYVVIDIAEVGGAALAVAGLLAFVQYHRAQVR